jgi:hypothetical protein
MHSQRSWTTTKPLVLCASRTTISAGCTNRFALPRQWKQGSQPTFGRYASYCHNLLHMYRVLSTSRNVRLLLSRNSVLALAGFSVISPKSPEAAPLLASQESVDAVVIGHSVDSKTRKKIIAELRRLCPDCLICFVYQQPDNGKEPLADVSLDVTKGPEPLILFLQERLPRENSATQT